ncbi:MAG: inositol-3-phosphate synthase [Spirochaetae bacterium HGW-Spirochaetae-5]|nr:MAG: inositol-3-phosphate synthase [Spirochaetae bacterium HGW-Spirochaetae-5]
MEIKSPEGKLGVLIPGLGAVSTTFIAGVMMIRKGLNKPIGSLAQMGKLRTGTGADAKEVDIKEFIPLAALSDMEFGGWDIFEDTVYESAANAQVLTKDDLESVKDELAAIKPWKAVFNKHFVKNLDGVNVKQAPTHWDMVQLVKEDIAKFKQEKNISRFIMVWCGSTEIHQVMVPGVHDTLANFEKALKENHPAIAPSMIYCYAALDLGIPYANGAPNLCNDIPAFWELADLRKTAMGGKDFKSGQTFMKTLLAPGFKARMLGMKGWYSTNILGNRDGAVLEDPESFKSKEVSKLSVLEQICQPELYPDLYGDFYHKVTINYYPPRGDNKEGWDNIDIFGWLGYPMQVKVNFLCRDSILAAPIVLDLVIFLDLAQRSGLFGNQEWLSFYWKSPMHLPNQEPEHDLFVQLMRFKNTLRWLRNEPPVTTLGHETYN